MKKGPDRIHSHTRMTEIAGIVLHRIMTLSQTRNAADAANEDIGGQSAMTTRMKKCAMMPVMTTHAPQHQTQGASHRTVNETRTATPQAPSTAHPTAPIALVTKNQTPNNTTKTNTPPAAEANPVTATFQPKPKAEAAAIVTGNIITEAAAPAATTKKTETETAIETETETEKTDTATANAPVVSTTPTKPQTPKQKSLTATAPAATNANICMNPNQRATTAQAVIETEIETENPAEGPPPRSLQPQPQQCPQNQQKIGTETRIRIGM